MWKGISGGYRSVFVIAVLVALSLQPVGAADTVQAAKADHDAGRLQSALIRLKNVLQVVPDSRAARVALAEVYVDLVDGAAAEQEINRARSVDGTTAGLLVTWGDALLLQGQNRRVLSEIRVEDAADTREQALVQAVRGEAHLALDDLEAAGVAFQAAIDLVPGLPRANVGLATIALRNEGRDAAAETLARALEAHPDAPELLGMLGDVELGRGRAAEAEQAFTGSIETARNKWLRHYQRALARVDLGNLAGAQDDIDAAEQQNRKSPLLSYARGRLAFANSDWEAAVSELGSFLNSKPNAYLAMYYAGLAALKLDQPQQADLYLSRFVAANPNALQGLKLLATARLDAGDPNAAIDVLAPAAAQDDPKPEVLALLFNALTKAGRYDEAQAVYAQLTRGAAGQSLDMRLGAAAAILNTGKTLDGISALEALVRDAPEFAAPKTLLGNIHLQRGEYRLALAQAEELVKLAPEDPQARLLRALALMGQQEFAKARVDLEEMLRLSPGNLSALLALARLHHDSGDLDAARAVLQDGLAQHPGNEQLVLALAELAGRQQGDSASVAALEEALSKSPASLALRLRLARAYLDAGEPDRVIATFQSAPADVREHPETLRLLARAQTATKNDYAAVSTLEKVSAKEPDSAQNWCLLAGAYAGVGNVTAMREAADRALGLDPEHPMMFTTLREVYSFLPDQRAKDEAVEHWTEIASGSRSIGRLQALHATSRGDFPKAVEIYTNLRTLAPNDRALAIGLMRAQMRAGRSFDAIDTANGWLTVHPDDIEVGIAAAQVMEQRGKQAEAIDAYRRVLKADPAAVIALNNLAVLLMEQEPAMAVDYAQQAHALRPDDANVADTLGSVLIAQDKAVEALPYLETAYAAMAANPSVAYRFATALAAAGDVKRARSVLLTIGPQAFPEQQQMRELLKRLSN